MSTTDKIIKIIADKAGVAPNALQPDTKLSQLSISSLDMVEIIFSLEDAFSISIPFNANQQQGAHMEFKTVRDIVAAVETVVASQQSA